jgi:hypothetical protein
MDKSQADQQRGILGEGVSRRGVLRRVGGGVTGVAAAAFISSIDARTARAAGGSPSARGIEGKSQVTPATEDAATPAADLAYGGRSISYVDEGGAVMIEIDGVPVDMVAFIEPAYVVSPLVSGFATPMAGDATPAATIFVGGQYFSMYFPFQGYDSIDDLAKELVDTEGKLWTLGQ